MTAGWGIRQREHTLAGTGRTATLREAFPLMQLVREGLFSDDLVAAFEEAKDGTLSDLALAVELTDAIAVGMFISPRLTRSREDAEALQAVGVDAVPIIALEDSELDEVVALAFETSREGAQFRAEGERARAGADGADVGEGPEPVPRPRARQPRRVPAGQAARPPAARRGAAGK